MVLTENNRHYKIFTTYFSYSAMMKIKMTSDIDIIVICYQLTMVFFVYGFPTHY